MKQRAIRRRTPALVVLAVSASLLAAPAAHACSCFLGDPRDALRAADAAFIGTLTDVHPVSDDPAYADYTFDVETSVKGDLGATIELRAGSTDASCAFEAALGDRIGAFIHEQDDRWWSGLCNQIHPDRLLAAAAPLPAPDGVGPARFVVGVNIGRHRLMTLDALGRTLAYGGGDGYAVDVDLCPGARRIVEAARIDRAGVIVLRELPSLRVIRRVDLLVGPRSPQIAAACLRPSGGRLVAVERHAGERWVHEIRGAEDRVVWHGRVRDVTLDGTRVLVLDGRALSVVDIATGRLVPLARVPAGSASLALSPDGSAVAGLSVTRDGTSSLFSVLRSDGSTERYALEGTPYASGDVVWIDDRRLAFMPRDGSRAYVLRAATMDPTLGFDGWYAGASTVSGRTAYGTSWGYLIAAALSDGDVRVVRLFDSPETGVLDVVPRSST
jgi:hypothetical protein